MSTFDTWTAQLDTYLDSRAAPAPSPFTKHLFHLTVGDPGFWCQLGTFLVAGAVFRRIGFGDGPHNSWMLDLATFSVGWYLGVVFVGQTPMYLPREQAGSALAYASSNFPERMAIVPFTSTFVPLLFGYKTASVENIAACWVQHFVALAFSHWSLTPKVVNRTTDLGDAPYVKAARSVEELRLRLAVRGAFHDASRGSLETFSVTRAPQLAAKAPADMPEMVAERGQPADSPYPRWYRPEAKPNRTELAHMFFGPWEGHEIPAQIRQRLDVVVDRATRYLDATDYDSQGLENMVASAPRPQ